MSTVHTDAKKVSQNRETILRLTLATSKNEKKLFAARYDNYEKSVKERWSKTSSPAPATTYVAYVVLFTFPRSDELCGVLTKLLEAGRWRSVRK
jgi:hypothetical protein